MEGQSDLPDLSVLVNRQVGNGEKMKEIWKDIFGWEGKYQISNFGRVKSLSRTIGRREDLTRRGHYRKIPERILKPFLRGKGYLVVKLQNQSHEVSYSVHRLVAAHFIPNPGALEQVNHKDGDKLNNKIDNLEWCNNKENQIHAVKNGLHNSWNPKPVIQIKKDGEEVFFQSSAEAGRKTSIHSSSINSVCAKNNKHRHTAGGFKWRYATEEEIKKYMN